MVCSRSKCPLNEAGYITSVCRLWKKRSLVSKPYTSEDDQTVWENTRENNSSWIKILLWHCDKPNNREEYFDMPNWTDEMTT